MERYFLDSAFNSFAICNELFFSSVVIQIARKIASTRETQAAELGSTFCNDFWKPSQVAGRETAACHMSPATCYGFPFSRVARQVARKIVLCNNNFRKMENYLLRCYFKLFRLERLTYIRIQPIF